MTSYIKKRKKEARLKLTTLWEVQGTEWVVQQDHAAINTAVNIYSNERYTKMRSIPTFKFVYILFNSSYIIQLKYV
jgi:hypothetical protein